MLKIEIVGRKASDEMTEAEVAEVLGTTRCTLASWRSQGRGPAFEKVGGWFIRYRAGDVARWLVEIKPWAKPSIQRAA